MRPFSVFNYPHPPMTAEVKAKLKEKAKQLLKSGNLDHPQDYGRSKNEKKISPYKLRRERCRSSAYHALIRETAMKQHLSELSSQRKAKEFNDKKQAVENFKQFLEDETEKKISDIKYCVPKKRIKAPQASCSKYLPCLPKPTIAHNDVAKGDRKT